MTFHQLNSGKPTAGQSQRSLEKLQADLDRMMELILDTTAENDRLTFYISVLAPWAEYPSENRQNIRIAQITKTTPQTVWNWRSGVTQCTALGRLYGFARMRFESEYHMATMFGEAVGRDFLAEAGLTSGGLK